MAKITEEIASTVIKGGYCVGCGACAVGADTSFRIELDPYGRYQAVKTTALESAISSKICPFSSASENEDQIASKLYSDSPHQHPLIGRFIHSYAGCVSDEVFHRKGSSGGIGKWILHELLTRNLVDTVIQIRPIQRQSEREKLRPLFEYDLMTTPQQIMEGSKSAYYPVQMSDVLNLIISRPGRYVITGVPCFIKAVRLLQSEMPVLSERIKYTVGLVCGHLKTSAYAEMIAWQEGVHPDQLEYIDFREKLPMATAKQKGIRIEGKANGQHIKSAKIAQNYFGTNYGEGFFKYRACDYCDDVVAETADIVVGDAWLPEYIPDGRGTSLVITRNSELDSIVQDAVTRNVLSLEPLSLDQVIQSQAGGFRHRRDGLAYRLYLTDRSGRWRPLKRVAPGKAHLSRKLQRMHRLRICIAEQSHIAFLTAKQQGCYSNFERQMMPLLQKYRKLDYSSGYLNGIWMSAKSFLRKITWISRLVKKIRSVVQHV